LEASISGGAGVSTLVESSVEDCCDQKHACCRPN
jgi:hypothetical protein